ncbi:MAG: response regulator [Caulobacteraceae bacterium]|nr:response regulator [Caulobacteraceae bacterium]
MIKVLNCVATQHDLRLVALAALVCLGSTLIAFDLFAKLPQGGSRRRTMWLGITSLVTGSGVWATHFIAMLAFRPGFPTGYRLGLTLLSLVAAIAFSAAGLVTASQRRIPAAFLFGGLILGSGVGVMHYLGMAAFHAGGLMLWDARGIALSLVIGAIFSVAALAVIGRSAARPCQVCAAGLLSLAICGLHFTGMSALTILPQPALKAPDAILSQPAMALVVAGLATTVILAIFALAGIDAQSRKRKFDELRDAIDAMPDGLAIYDASHHLITWNTRFPELLGLDPSHLEIGLSFPQLLRILIRESDVRMEPGEDERWVQARLDARRAPRSTIEQQMISGRWLRLEHRVTSQGGVVSVCADVTDLKRDAEVLARARDEANAANAAKSEFLANMSHEIRTPMNGVIGMNALILRTPLTPDQKTYAEAVATSASALMTIINDILDISKLEAGKVELESLEFNMFDVVEDTIELLSPKAIDKGLEITSWVDEGARGPFRGDPLRLRQILLNLLSNALKFTDRGGATIEVNAICAQPGRARLRIEVSDTGIGISPTARAKLFQKFQQADGSITRRFGGTGLGLSICRKLVEMMDGQIGVEDRPGGGSIFWLEIDLEAASAASDSTLAHDALPGARILVVDGANLSRRILARQLLGEGAQVEQAASGSQALSALDNHPAGAFDIVLISQTLPDMPGDQLAARIRERRATGHSPKLAVMAFMGAALGDQGTAVPWLDAVISKPVRHHALIDRMASLMNTGQAEPVPALEAAGAPEPEPRVGTILLAEDNPINTLLACTLLREIGFEVETVVNGALAVEAASRRAFDLVLMDVQMPVMDGLQATRLIRRGGGLGATVPIIAMTANAMHGDQEACLAAGMDAFISKPIDPATFLSVVGEIADREPPDRESTDEFRRSA